MGVRIAQISDTHLSAAKPFFVEGFERVARTVNRRGADLVVHTGDMSLDGAREPADLTAAAGMLAQLPAPVHYIPGNHDFGESSAGNPPTHAIVDEDRQQAYVDVFGSDFWALDVPGWRLIGLNSQLFGSCLAADEAQWAFLEKQSRTAEARAIALFTHRPLFDRSPSEEIVGGRFVHPEPRERLLALFENARLTLVSSGHVHQFRKSQFDRTAHVWAPATGFVFPDRLQPRYGQKVVGYVEIELRPDGSHTAELIVPADATVVSIADVPEAYGPV